MVLLVLVLLLGGSVWGKEAAVGLVVDPSNHVESPDNGLANTELILAFAMFRHGDRTPDDEELQLYKPVDTAEVKAKFFPYGTKALTNRGKQRGYNVGEYLRRRYDGFVSQLYLPEEVVIRTTDYARTKMTALTAMAAMYQPLPAQKWNPALNWQPVPYYTKDYSDDDLLYWYNCPRYQAMLNKVDEIPDVKSFMKPYKNLLHYISEKTYTNITSSENVFYLDNLFQALNNIGIPTPTWAQEITPHIKDITKIEFATEFYNSDLVRLATGVLLADILNATTSVMQGNRAQPKLRLYFAHENNVAALMAAAAVFQPHQPQYGAGFSLELRRANSSGKYGIAAVYCPVAGGKEVVLPIRGCGGQQLCDYDTFVSLVQDIIMTKDEYNSLCPNTCVSDNCDL